MAGVAFTVTAQGMALSVTGAKTFVQIIAAAQQRVLIHRIFISGSGIITTAAPVPLELLLQTTAGTVTSVTPTKINSGDNETLQVTAGKDASAEPTASTIKWARFWHPQTAYDLFFPRPFVIIGGERLGLRQNAAAGAADNITICVEGEE